MKKTASTSSPLIPIETAIGTGAIAMAAMAMCPFMLPLLPVIGLGMGCLARKGVAHDVDQVAEDAADTVADTWERYKLPGERGVSVSSTLHSGGALFDLPMTRTYHYEAEDEDC